MPDFVTAPDSFACYLGKIRGGGGGRRGREEGEGGGGREEEL